MFVILPYFVWFYGVDLHTPTNGKVVYRVRDWMRNLIVWEWYVNYFPIQVYKLCELEPTFTYERVEETAHDDEEDLVSEDSRTIMDAVFKFFGLLKRINDSDCVSPPPDDDRRLSVGSERADVNVERTEKSDTEENADKNDVARNSAGRSTTDKTVVDRDATIDKSVVEMNPMDRGATHSSTSRATHTASAKYRKVSSGPRYIFGYHPHGVISMGAMGLFATNALRNEPFLPPLRILRRLFHDPSTGTRVFPGIGYIFPLTLTTQFTIPFFRDYLLSLGLTSASAKNIKSIISNGDNSVCIVVGGAQESLLNDMVGDDTRVGMGYHDTSDEESDHVELPPQKRIRLVLRKRKGFVKLALELGNVSLVPTFAFGEVDIYRLSHPPPGSWGYSFQQWMKRTFLFTIPFFSARGVFIYDYGIVPYRTPINIVTGRPIYVPTGLMVEEEVPPDTPHKLSSITNLLSLGSRRKPKVRRHISPDVLNHYHRLYVEELQRMYDENKHRFGYGDVELIITE